MRSRARRDKLRGDRRVLASDDATCSCFCSRSRRSEPVLVPWGHGQCRHAGHDEPPWAYRWQLACIAVTAENPLTGTDR
jgi:hypothetical protein